MSTIKSCLPILFMMAFSISSNAQNATNSLFLQTSEMHDMMVQYTADLGSITRFYNIPLAAGVGGARGGGGQFGGNNYHSPERRARILTLIDAYLKKMDAINFDKMSIYGKVDYILFKRRL
jgi:hypothetical protein